MDKEELIEQLTSLYYKLQSYEEITDQLNSDEELVEELKSRPFVKVKQYDDTHLERYIINRIGNEPEEIKGLGLLWPGNKKKNQQDIADYNKRRMSVMREYFSVFQEDRDQLLKEEKEERSRAINSINERIYNYELAESAYIDEIAEYDFISDNLKKANVINDLINYLDYDRADTLQEAINLYHEEQHRRKMEEYAREQIRLVKEALDTANEAKYLANEALDKANDAYERAEESYRRAEDAYNKADDALSKAEEMYYKVEDLEYKIDG